MNQKLAQDTLLTLFQKLIGIFINPKIEYAKNHGYQKHKKNVRYAKPSQNG